MGIPITDVIKKKYSFVRKRSCSSCAYCTFKKPPFDVEKIKEIQISLFFKKKRKKIETKTKTKIIEEKKKRYSKKEDTNKNIPSQLPSPLSSMLNSGLRAVEACRQILSTRLAPWFVRQAGRGAEWRGGVGTALALRALGSLMCGHRRGMKG